VRTYNSEIGIVGRKPGHYDVFVGGDAERLGELYAEELELDHVVRALRPLLAAWASQRLPAESLAGFYARRYASGARTDLLTGGKDAPAIERITAAVTQVSSLPPCG
jgi:sulfite reductase (NADPH) hemoprotein beta-component